MGEVTGKEYRGNEEPGRLRHIECVGVGVLLLCRGRGGEWGSEMDCREKVQGEG